MDRIAEFCFKMLMWMQGSIYSQPRHKEEVGWLNLRSAVFTPGKAPVLILQETLSGPQHQSGHGVKKYLYPSATRDRTLAVQHVARALSLELPMPIIIILFVPQKKIVLFFFKSWGILGRPTGNFYRISIIPKGEPKYEDINGFSAGVPIGL